VIELLPGSMKVADMVADNPGSWMFQCHVADHMMHGMYTTYVVHPEGAPAQSAALGDAFFSAQRIPESLRIQSAQLEIDFAPGSTNAVTFKISGLFSPLRLPNFGKGPVEVRLGQRVVPVTMNTSGRGEGGDFRARALITFQVLRAGRDALGATLGFELTLSGDDWRQELQTLGFRSSLGTNAEVAVPLALAFDRTTLSGTVMVRYRVENSGKGVGNF
jgi:hypothetical protein